VIILELILAFIITFILLVLSVYKGIFLAYPLFCGLMLFFMVAVKRGYRVKDILIMALKGAKKSFIVIKVFILIGVIMSMWMASGTVPAIVYYGIKLIRPDVFILSAFLISCFVSFLIGTSVGTSGTVGVALMVIAKGGGVSIPATAGAIIAGAYFGDRCSPMSSSASLVAHLTDTDIYNNVKNMIKTSIIPLGISIIFYFAVSRIFPLHSSSKVITSEIAKVFSVNLIVLLPALIIIVLSVFKVNVKVSMGMSIAVAFLISILLQQETVLNCINYGVFGYSLEKTNPLYPIIKGGGIISMLKTSLIILIASALAGIIEETKMLNIVEAVTYKANSRPQLFKNLTITSVFAAAMGCSQVFAVIMTNMLNKRAYEKNNMDNSVLAIDLENTAIMISALIPWNLALFAPSTILGADASCIPYLFYVYFLPIWSLMILNFNSKKRKFFVVDNSI